MSRLQVKEIAYAYHQKHVLNQISFLISVGEIVGLLGVNGAGKSTLFRLIAGLYCLQKGTIFFDNALAARPKASISCHMRSQMGVVFQECSLDSKLSAKMNLYLSGMLYGLSSEEIKQKLMPELNEFGLQHVANQPVKTFSGGMKRRLELLRALLHQPQFLLMDEPSSGLDQEGFFHFWEKIFIQRKERGLTVFLATHRVEEAEKCDRLLILHEGNLIASKTPSELKNELKGDFVSLRFLASTSNVQKYEWLKKLQEHFSDLSIKLSENEIHVIVQQGHQLVPRFVEILPQSVVESVYVRRPTLSDAFLKITGTKL